MDLKLNLTRSALKNRFVLFYLFFKRQKYYLKKFGLKFFFYKLLLYFFDWYKIKGNFLTYRETFDFIKKSKKSVIRMGDGEILLMMGKSINWQCYDYELDRNLFKIIINYNKNSPYLLCLPNYFLKASNHELKKIKRFKMWYPFKILYLTKFPKDCIYGDALTFRVMGKLSMNINLLFNYKYYIIVANENILNNIDYKNFKKVLKIKVPQKNAYSHKDIILNEIKKKIIQFHKEEIVALFSCGPLAKILVYEISKIGYRGIDVGYYFNLKELSKVS